PGIEDLVPVEPGDVVATFHRRRGPQRFMTLTVLRHGSGRWEDGAETIVTVDRLKAALANGTLFSHLFRYREARILTHRLETIGRPLKLAIFLRMLSRGGCFVDDESGRR